MVLSIVFKNQFKTNNQSINHINSAQWSITDQIYTKNKKDLLPNYNKIS